MKNSEIIKNELKKINLDYLDPMHDIATKTEWLRRGYKIKYGESARFMVKIWKPINDEMMLVPASFFDITQIEKEPRYE